MVAMKVFDKAVSNTIYIFSNWVITTLTAFVFWLIAGKFLTQEQYGIALTAINLGVFIINIITLGFPVAISKLIPEYLRKKQFNKIKAIISSSFILTLFLNIVVSTIFLFNLEFLSSLIKIPKSVIIFTLIYILLGSINVIFSVVVYSYQNMKKYLTMGIAFSISKILVSTAILFYGYTYFGPLIGVTAGSLISLLICFTPKYVSFKTRLYEEKELYFYAFSGIVGTAAFAIISNFQYVLVSIIKTVNTTGIFGVAMMISSVISVVPIILNTAIYPIISGASSNKKTLKSISSLIRYTFRYSLFFTLPLILTFSLSPELFVLSFSSYRFIEAGKLLPILTTASFLFGISTTFTSAIYAMKRPKEYRDILLIIAIVFLVLTSLLTYYFSDLGTSIGYLMTMIVFFILATINLKKIIKIKFLTADLIKILIASLSFSILYFVKPFVMNLISAGIFVALSGTFYLILLLLMKFYNKGDIRILKYISSKVKISKPIIDVILKIIKN